MQLADTNAIAVFNLLTQKESNKISFKMHRLPFGKKHANKVSALLYSIEGVSIYNASSHFPSRFT